MCLMYLWNECFRKKGGQEDSVPLKTEQIKGVEKDEEQKMARDEVAAAQGSNESEEIEVKCKELFQLLSSDGHQTTIAEALKGVKTPEQAIRVLMGRATIIDPAFVVTNMVFFLINKEQVKAAIAAGKFGTELQQRFIELTQKPDSAMSLAPIHSVDSEGDEVEATGDGLPVHDEI